MVGAHPFGPRIEATADTWMDAVAQARALGSSEIAGALHHPDLGEICVPWSVQGDPNRGLSGLIARGRADVIARLPEIVASGTLEMGRTRARIHTADHIAVIRLDFRADKTSPTLEKRRLFTAFEKDRPPGKFAPSPASPGEAVSSPHPPDGRLVGEATAPDASSGAHSPRQPVNVTMSAEEGAVKTSSRLETDRPQGKSAPSPASPGEAVTGRAPKDPTQTDSSALPTESRMSADAGAVKLDMPASDILDLVPLVHDDGSVDLVSRAVIGRVAEYKRWMKEVIDACKS